MNFLERKAAEAQARMAEQEARREEARTRLLARLEQDAPDILAFLAAVDDINRARGNTGPEHKTRIRGVEFYGGI